MDTAHKLNSIFNKHDTMKATFMAKGMETNVKLLSSLLCSFICFHGSENCMDLSLEITALSHYLLFYTQ